MIAISSIVLFVFVLQQTTHQIESRKLLNSVIKCNSKYNITARFILSAKSKILKHSFYHVSVCQPYKNNRFCLDGKAVWRKQQCEENDIGVIYVVYCHLTPANLKLGSTPDYWIIKTFALKITVRKNRFITDEKMIPITPLLRCN